MHKFQVEIEETRKMDSVNARPKFLGCKISLILNNLLHKQWIDTGQNDTIISNDAHTQAHLLQLN